MVLLSLATMVHIASQCSGMVGLKRPHLITQADMETIEQVRFHIHQLILLIGFFAQQLQMEGRGQPSFM